MNTQDSTVPEKPPWSPNKTPLYALGFIPKTFTIEKILYAFKLATGTSLEKELLENHLKESYDNGDIMYFEYDPEGNLVKSGAVSLKCSR